MYIELLKNKLLEQEQVYLALKNGDASDICYKSYRDAEFGTQDANYTNRMRLSYYLLYENINDESVIKVLFEEELKDRQNNSFQGIGSTIQILTFLLQRYNKDHKYDGLFEAAKNANFDCYCGYDANEQMNSNIHSNDLMDCIYLCQDMKYKDVMTQLVQMWKEDISDWGDSDYATLIKFNEYLGKESENEEIHKMRLENAFKTGDTFKIVSAYEKIIRYYIDSAKYETAYVYLKKLIDTTDCESIKRIQLFRNVLEATLEIICNYPVSAKELWVWVKPELLRVRNWYGNLYVKAIAAAKAVGDAYAGNLEKEYLEWKKKVGLK